MPLGYSDELGKLIYETKLDTPDNDIVAEAIYQAFGEYPSSYRRLREWHNRYKIENGISDTMDHYAQKVGLDKRVESDEIEHDNIQGTFESIINASYRNKQSLSIGVISDVHLPDENPLAMRLAIELLNRVQPELIIWNGDLYDLSTESRYPNSHRAMAEDSFSVALKRFDNYRKQIKFEPFCEILVTGNHDQRWRDCLNGMSASIRNSALRDFDYQLKSRKILFGGWDVSQVYYKQQLLIQHGDSVGVNTARNNLLKAGYGFHLSWFGHAHKHQDSVQTSLAGEFASVVSAAIQNKSPNWSKTTAPSNWQYGCGFITLTGENDMPLWSNVKFGEHGKKMRALFGGEIVEVG